MKFVKVYVVDSNDPYIINVDSISAMRRHRNNFRFFVAGSNRGYYDVDEENAKIIFDAMGVSLD